MSFGASVPRLSDFFSAPVWKGGAMPFGSLRLFRVTRWGATSADPDHGDREEVASLESANVVSSQFKHSDEHMIAIDLDVPAALIPSSTPGHSHLYIESRMSWETYAELLTALVNAGVLEPGYVAASRERKATHLRLPWVRKQGV